MNDSPLVSICIPTYNGEKHLVACLDSCIRQSFDNYEILICDDGSTDATRMILARYKEQYPEIRVLLNEQNLGLVGNWNNCLAHARGAWIKFVFQDDYISDNCLQKFVSAITPSAQLLVSRRNFILPDNAPADMLNYYTHEVRTLENTSSHRIGIYPPGLISGIAVANLCMNFIGEPSLLFFRKTLIIELGFFEASLQQVCDLEFALRIGSKYGLIYIPENLCFFRVHAESATRSNIENKFFELHYIEPILFAWFLLFHPHFTCFRKHLNFFQTLKLRTYFKWKVYVANTLNLKENQNHPLFADEGRSFEEVSKYKKAGLFVKLISLFKKVE